MKKKIIGILLCTMLVLNVTAIAGCGSNNRRNPGNGNSGHNTETDSSHDNTTEASSGDGSSASGRVYYLNFKPEVDEVWQELAAAYTAEFGVDVKVVTAASGTYEQTLQAEITKNEAPTLFQINGPVGYQNWKDYTKDLSNSPIYAALADKSIAVTGEDGGVYGIPYAVESYGIIYNNAIMERYFALDGARAGSMDEINNFAKLKAVVEDMQARKNELGIEGVFASTSMAPGEDWRWQTHLANIPIYYEYKDNGVSDMAEIQFTYAPNFKNIWDLYINNSITKPSLTGAKNVNDSMAEFALGQVAMVQNGNWGWGQIAGVAGNVVAPEDVKFMPIYTGVAGEENQGLCTGTENFWCINAKASEADQKATEDFIYWLISDDTGKDWMVNRLGNAAPFTTFGDDEKPTDPLAKEMFRHMESGTTSVAWNFTTFPSQAFKDNFGRALAEYNNGNMEWREVVDFVIAEWANEK
jgi:raffinose/stachyose/melibiose transport system substrate-binding protein